MAEHLRHFGASLDSIGDALIYTDRAGRIVDLNQVATLLTGWSREQAIGRPLDEVFPITEPGTGAPMESRVTRSIRTGEITQRASARLLPPGRTAALTLSGSSAPIRDPAGEIVGAFIVFRDITDETRMREAAAEREQALQVIFDACPFPMAIQGLEDGVYRVVNPAFERVAGFSSEELLGRHPVEAQPSNRLFPYPEMRARLLQEGGLNDAPISCMGDDGHERHGIAVARVIEYRGERCSLCMVVDVTEYRQLQEALSHVQREEAIGQLAGGVAHDFNNMLGGILGIADLLRGLELPREKQLRHLERIIAACRQAADLSSKLLAFARQGKVESRPVDLHDVLDNALALLEPTIHKRVEVVTDFGAATSRVTGDGSMLMNAFLNLGINASHAMPEGGRLRLSTRTTHLEKTRLRSGRFNLKEGRHILLEVQDTGTGISPEHLPRIFEPYFTTKSPGKGTGLGLAAVYGAVQQHHGAIEVSSVPGEGTTFRLFFPLDEAFRPTGSRGGKAEGRTLHPALRG